MRSLVRRQTCAITNTGRPHPGRPKGPESEKGRILLAQRVNRATVVTGLRNGQFGEDLARRAAAGIAAVEAMGEADPALRVKSYIAWEPLLIKPRARA